jgi:hypothetical protein
MRIGTPVATMGIRGTVGGVTTANDGTVHFYVSQSATGAVIINAQGQVIANVVQDGPMIVVRPAGPLQVIAEEVQKSPAQLALELAALQQIVSIKAVGDQLLQQFFQQQNPNNPNPQSPQNGPHTQIQIDLHNNVNNAGAGDPTGLGANNPFDQATIHLPQNDPNDPVLPTPVVDLLHANLPPITFAPLIAAVQEDHTLTFSGVKAISVYDVDTTVITVTVTATHGLLSLSGVAGLSFIAGNGANAASMTFSGTQAAINAALDGMTYKPAADYNGPASLTITAQDDGSHSITTSVPIAVTSVNDAPVLAHASGVSLAYTQNGPAAAIDGTLTLSDADSTTLTGATVTISGNFHPGEDVLGFVNQLGITGSFAPQTGVLTLTGTASLAEYQAALRSVTFSNTSDSPPGAARTISFQVDDGASEHSASNIVNTIVEVTAVNDAAPVLSLTGSVEDQFNERAYNLNSGTSNWPTNWIENENGDYTSSPTTGEIQIKCDPAISDGNYRLFLSDDDNESGPADTIQRTADLSGATTATLTFDYRLQIAAGDPSDVVKIWASADGSNFTLVGQVGATGYGSFVDSDYHQFSVDISNYISGTTTIRFSVDDGVDDGDLFFVDNVRIASSGSEYTTGVVNDSKSVAVFGGNPAIVDDDSAHLASALILATLDGHQNYETYSADQLTVDVQALSGATGNGFSGSWQGLSWQFSGGSNGLSLSVTGEASLSTYEQLIAAVRFATNSGNDADRIFTLTVNDGTHDSAPVTSTVSVHVDEAPTFDTSSLTTVGNEIQTLVTALAVIDGDAGSDPMTFSMNAVDGTLSFFDAGSGVTVGGSDTGTLTGRGALSAINAALTNGIVYTSANQEPLVSSALATIDDGHGKTDTVNFVFTNGTVTGPVTLEGTSGKDMIFAAGMDATLTGNGGSDTFVFKADNGGVAHVTDFEVANDFLQISSSIFASVDAVLASAHADGSNTVINTPGNGTLILNGVDNTAFQSIDHSHIIIV